MTSARLHQFSDFSDDGTVTVEYAVATVAAAIFAGILIAAANSDQVVGAITDLIDKALTLNF